MKPLYDFKQLEAVFKVNEEVKLSNENKEYLKNIIIPIYEKRIQQIGTNSSYMIKEEISNVLLTNNKKQILKYLNLEIDEDKIKDFEKEISDPKFLKIESKEDNKDFFKSALYDDSLNDIHYALLNYLKQSDGAKEVFIKQGESFVDKNNTTPVIMRIIANNFTKMNLLSEKKDEEQTDIIKMCLSQIREILLDLPYQVCGRVEMRQVLTIVATKLINLVGLSEGYRKLVFDSLQEGYKSSELSSSNDSVQALD